MDKEAIRKYLEEEVPKQRAAQGLPPKVTDPVVLMRIAEIIKANRVERGEKCSG